MTFFSTGYFVLIEEKGQFEMKWKSKICCLFHARTGVFKLENLGTDTSVQVDYLPVSDNRVIV